ncbi:MAG: hypothetical protein K1X53_10800 [Candidatus Sumerlaeaceae bacterium]|nr:hypothetical protein [Candidatus Sumerlaeaceae bacterium]
MPETDAGQSNSPGATPLSRRAAGTILAAVGFIYAVLVVSHWNKGYLDFGDGNYMYISWRLSQGAILYRDVVAPQPPVHLILGSFIARLGSLFEHPLFAFRSFSLLLHLATMVLVYLCTLRVVGGNSTEARESQRATGIVAASIYLLLPIGFWWTLGYQSQPIQIFWLLSSFLLLISWQPSRAVGAGALMALAPLTNMTSAPYALFSLVYLGVRRPRLLAFYAIPLITIVAGVIGYMEWRTGAYFECVIHNQAGAFPRQEFLQPGQTPMTYVLGKILREGRNVLDLEGGYVLLALLGLARFARRGPEETREYASFYGFLAMCSIVYVAKGGTVDYIFTIGEPFVAIFGAYLVTSCWQAHVRGSWREWSWNNFAPAAQLVALVAIALVVGYNGLIHSYGTLKQRSYELPEYETMQLVRDMQKATAPADLVLSPPMYAFLAQRKIAEDYSELLLWTLKYANEKADKKPARGVEVVNQIASLLDAKKIAYIVLETGQTGRISEITDAIARSYDPTRKDPMSTLNTRLMFYKPKP